MNAHRPEGRKQSLERRKRELQQRCDAIRKDYRRGLAADSQERAIELENAEALAEILRVSESNLAEIEEELRALPD